MAGFVIGILLFVGALYWLYQQKKKDIAACAATLGFAPYQNPKPFTGTTAEGVHFHETPMLEGAIEGTPATMAVRHLRLRPTVGTRRGSQFTVLTLAPEPPASGSFRLQPRGVMSGLEQLWQGTPTQATGHAEFDAAYRLYAEDLDAALAILTPELRDALLALREDLAGPLPDSLAGKAAAGFLLGSIEVEGGTVSYHLFGSPTAKIADHLKQVSHCLLRLAKA